MAWSILGLRPRTNSAHAFALSCALIALSEGCTASFPQQHSAQIPRIVRKDASAYKPAVLLDVSFDFDIGSRVSEHKQSQAFRGIVAKVSEDSGMFSRYTLDASRRTDFEYAIKIKLINHGSLNAAMAAGFITGASLGLIPTAVTDHFRLTASVTDSSDNELKTYEINDSVTSWFGVWTFFPSDEAAERKIFYALWENMVKNLYQQISDDSLFASNR